MGTKMGNAMSCGEHRVGSTFVEALLVGPWLQASGVAPAPLSSSMILKRSMARPNSSHVNRLPNFLCSRCRTRLFTARFGAS